MTTQLVKGRTVIRGVDSDGKVDQIEGGAVLVRDGVIAALGKSDDLLRDAGDAEIVGGEEAGFDHQPGPSPGPAAVLARSTNASMSTWSSSQSARRSC